MLSRVNSFIEMLEMFELLELLDDSRNSLENFSRYSKTLRKLIEDFSKHLEHFEDLEIILISRSKNIFCRFILKIVDVIDTFDICRTFIALSINRYNRQFVKKIERLNDYFTCYILIETFNFLISNWNVTLYFFFNLFSFSKKTHFLLCFMSFISFQTRYIFVARIF